MGTGKLNNIGFVSSQTISGGSYKNIAMPANYVVYEEDSTYYARRGIDSTITESDTSSRKVIQHAIDNSPSGTVFISDDISLDGTISGSYSTVLDLGGHGLHAASAINPMIMMNPGFTVENGILFANGVDFSNCDMIRFQTGTQFGSYTTANKPALLSNLHFKSVSQQGTAIKLKADVDGRGLEGVFGNNLSMRDLEYGIHLYASSNSNSATYVNGTIWNGVHGRALTYFIYLDEFDLGDTDGNVFQSCTNQAGAMSEESVHIIGDWNRFMGTTWDWTGAAGTYSHVLSGSSCRNNLIEDMHLGGTAAAPNNKAFQYVDDQGSFNTLKDLSYGREQIRNLYTRYLHSFTDGGTLEFSMSDGASNTEHMIFKTRNVANDADKMRLQIYNRPSGDMGVIYVTGSIFTVQSVNGGTDRVRLIVNDSNSAYYRAANTDQKWLFGCGDDEKFRFRNVTAGDTYPFIIERGAPTNSLYVMSGAGVVKGYIGINTATPKTQLHVMGDISSSTGLYCNWISSNVGGGASNLSDLTIDANKDWNDKGISNLDYVSSQTISGSWITPLYVGKPTASEHPGHIIRTSGNANGTWVWMSVYNGSAYEWIQLAIST